MDVIKNYLIQSPLILAAIALMAVAMLLSGKEKGAPLILAGALGLCVMTLLTPIIYSVIVPKLIMDAAVENIGNI